jgi:hypothetical protein
LVGLVHGGVRFLLLEDHDLNEGRDAISGRSLDCVQPAAAFRPPACWRVHGRGHSPVHGPPAGRWSKIEDREAAAHHKNDPSPAGWRRRAAAGCTQSKAV